MDGYQREEEYSIQKKDGIWKLFEQIDMGSNVSLAVNTEESKVLRIDRRVHHAGHVSFPLCHYHGITIGFEMGTAQLSLKNAMGVLCATVPFFMMGHMIQRLVEGNREVSAYMTDCLIMAFLWTGKVVFHAVSTSLSHKATFYVLGNIRKFLCCQSVGFL